MILAVDMGNTHIEVGIVSGGEILMSSRISTDRKKTEAEYAVCIKEILDLYQIDPQEIEGGILSSVVPPLTYILQEAVKLVTGKMPIVVGPGTKTGMHIKIDDPKTLGADMVVAAVGGIELYGTPLILIDMGTATTITAVDREGSFLGGAIVPGVRISLDALANSTTQLPMIALDSPRKAIGTNTVDCMKSGILYGQAAMLDGMIDRMREELGAEASVVATGGLSGLIVPYCRHNIILERELMIQGLKIIYDRNSRA